MRKTLSLDLETYSDIDLAKCGVYAYVDSPNFEILLMAYSFDEDEVQIIDLASGEVMPEEVKTAVLSDDVIKTAFNANFERICLSRYFNMYLKADSWNCSAVQASMLALPPSLEGVSEVLGPVSYTHLAFCMTSVFAFLNKIIKTFSNSICGICNKFVVFRII